MYEQDQAKSLLSILLERDMNGLAVVSGHALTVRYANPAWHQLFRVAQEQVVGMPYEAVCQASAGFPKIDQLLQAVTLPRPLDFNDIVQELPGGRKRRLTLRATSLKWEGAPSLLLILQAHQAEDPEREWLMEQVEIERSRLAAIIKNASQAILVIDEHGLLVQANPAAERIFGQPMPVGQDYTQLTELHICDSKGKPFAPRELPLVKAALDGLHANNEELLVLLADGQRRNLLSTSAPVIDQKGSRKGAVAILHDITLRKRVDEELRAQANRSMILASLSQAFAETGLNHAELLETIVREIGGISGDMSFIQLVGEDGYWTNIAAFSHPDGAIQRQVWPRLQHIRQPVDAGELGKVCSSGQALRVFDASLIDLKRIFPPGYYPVMAQLQVKHALIVPLRAHGRGIGSLGIMRSRISERYNMEDQFFYQDLADRAALALEDARLYEQEARRLRELSALHQATTALLATLDLETLLIQILDAAQTAIPSALEGALYLLTADTGNLEIRAATFFHDPRIQKVSLQKFQELAAQAVLEKRPILLNQIHIPREPQALHDPRAAGDAGAATASAIIAPLMKASQVLGALSLASPYSGQFNENDLRLLDSFAATATTALHNATLYAEVQRLATTDTLTELFNRRRFFELGEMEMHRFRRFSRPLSAIMMDLDNFKNINDTFGHATGDNVLFSVASRLRENIRVIDILGRYGGDEFAILLPNATLAETREIAERIRNSVLATPIQHAKGTIQIAISLGLAQATDQNDTLSALMGRADSALYQAKTNGRNCVVEFT